MTVTRTELHSWLSTLTGVELSRGGVSRTLDTVLNQRCTALGCDLEEYSKLARAPGSAELEILTNAVTVVYTWFFRDREQLAAIEELVLECSSRGTVNVWVPGCATGEDAFSVALLARRLDIAIAVLGTDINTVALEHAAANRYPKSSLRDVQDEFRSYFSKLDERHYAVASEIREFVRFERHNLLHPAPGSSPKAGWDIVLCRNVLIYFNAEETLGVFDRLLRSLRPGGYLVLGSSEVVYDVPPQARALYVGGRLVLQKRPPPSSVPPLHHQLPQSAQTLVPPSRPGAHHAPLPALPPKVQRVPTAPATQSNTKLSEQDAHLDLGHEHLDRGRLTEALGQYHQACVLDPTCPRARMYRGVTHYLCGAVRDAADDLRAALFLDEKLWPAAFYLALSYESMGLPRDALREYKHVVRLCEQLPTNQEPDPLLAAWRRDVLELATHRLRP